MENSKTYQYRKVMKPMLERKRRARINKCLDDLKDLMVECLTEEGEHIVRLEKADILELTVDYLKKQKHKKQYIETTTVESFRTGYIHAANEVSKALASIPDVNINLGTTLMTHLGHRLNQIQPLIVSTLQCQQQSSNQQSTNLMSPLKIELENEVNSSISSISSVLSQMSPTSSGYHSDPPSPVSSESSFFEKNSILKNNYEESSKDVWRPW